MVCGESAGDFATHLDFERSCGNATFQNLLFIIRHLWKRDHGYRRIEDQSFRKVSRQKPTQTSSLTWKKHDGSRLYIMGNINKGVNDVRRVHKARLKLIATTPKFLFRACPRIRLSSSGTGKTVRSASLRSTKINDRT